MAIVKKTKLKGTARSAKKVLTKRQKVAKRVTKIQKMMEYRKNLKRGKKGKVVPIKKKRQEEADREIIDFTSKKEDEQTTDAEINILNILGFSG